LKSIIAFHLKVDLSELKGQGINKTIIRENNTISRRTKITISEKL
jgi:hypothetical protein